MISYAPFFKTLKDRDISQYDLLHMGVSGRLLNSIKNNRSITISSINKLCMILHCTPNEIFEIIPTDEELEALRKKFRPSHRQDLHKYPLKSDRKLSGK